MSDFPRRTPRPYAEIVMSKALASLMNTYDPVRDRAGWSISDTGTVWTEIVAFPGTPRERRAQVIAIEPGFLLLVLPLVSDPEFASVTEDFATLAGAEAYWEGRSNV